MSLEAVAVQPRFSRERLAVSLIFLQNGYIVGNWAPKVPEFAARLGLSEAGVGVMVIFFGIGSLISMPLVGWRISGHGSRGIMRLLAALAPALLLLITLAPNTWVAALVLASFGALIGGTDVAMNANAVEVERSERRAIMSSCHGFWSLGGFVGAASGGAMIEALGPHGHAAVAMLVAAVLVAVAWPKALADHPHDEAAGDNDRQERGGHAPLRSGVLWFTGIMALIGMNSEGAILDWGALYLRNELGADVALSGFAFAALSGAMALMRFLGDGIRNRFGAVRTLRVSVVVGAVGLLIAGSAAGPLTAVAGFALAGLGLANTVPILFSAAGNLPGLPKGVAISLVSALGYSGILFAPSLIGFIAEHTGLAIIFTALAALAVVILLGSSLARHADRDASG